MTSPWPKKLKGADNSELQSEISRKRAPWKKDPPTTTLAWALAVNGIRKFGSAEKTANTQKLAEHQAKISALKKTFSPWKQTIQKQWKKSVGKWMFIIPSEKRKSNKTSLCLLQVQLIVLINVFESGSTNTLSFVGC